MKFEFMEIVWKDLRKLTMVVSVGESLRARAGGGFHPCLPCPVVLLKSFTLDAIVIHEVYEEGAAARDGRLWAGDQILEVNGVDLRSASHEEAITALRQTPQQVRLVVYRDEAHYRDEENLEIFPVDLQKKAGRGLGLSIVGKRSGNGVFISDIVKGGAAALDGRLIQGDQILSVNGEDMRSASQETVATVLKCAQGLVQLEIGRLRAGSWTSSRKTSQISQGAQHSTHSSCHPSLAPVLTSLQGLVGTKRASDSPPQDSGADTGPRTVEIIRELSDALGISIAGGKGSPLGDIPIFIAMIQASGVAARTQKLKVSRRGRRGTDSTWWGGREVPPWAPCLRLEFQWPSEAPQRANFTGETLHLKCITSLGIDFPPLLYFQVGDRIVSINGQPLDGLSHADVVGLLKNAYGRVILQPPAASPEPAPPFSRALRVTPGGPANAALPSQSRGPSVAPSCKRKLFQMITMSRKKSIGEQRIEVTLTQLGNVGECVGRGEDGVIRGAQVEKSSRQRRCAARAQGAFVWKQGVKRAIEGFPVLTSRCWHVTLHDIG
ncbi:hypothetical protein HPG69_011097 [Diceros bicornis minor]|uniref:PDZ domain-containing protein n=1 Tax=Diceros bicornis minor TaxID=77932 RepID=A0A7J7F6P9_DICBM|nr:hypothetical protein HPG69_011097 [Diceros bicornis minor]